MSGLISQFEGGATSGEAPVAVTNAYSVVIGPLDVQAYDRYTIYTLNVGGGAAADLTSVVLETAPESSSDVWVQVEECLSADLAAGAADARSLADKSLKFVRVRAQTSVGNTTARFWLSAGGYEG